MDKPIKSLSAIPRLVLMLPAVVGFLIIGSNIMGYLAFGHGLGDLLIDLEILVALIVGYLILYFGKRFGQNTTGMGTTIAVLLYTVIALSLLKATIWRGPEFPWNGRFWLRQQ